MPVVLIVDDDESVRDVLRESFELAGWIVHTADGAIRGIELLIDAQPQCDCVVADMRMPGPDGAAFLQALHDSSLDRKLIRAAITGDRSPQTERDIKATNPHIFMHKPFNPVDLIHELNRRLLPTRPVE